MKWIHHSGGCDMEIRVLIIVSCFVDDFDIFAVYEWRKIVRARLDIYVWRYK